MDDALHAGLQAWLQSLPHALVLCFVASFVFAMFLGPRPPLALGLGAGFSAGLCWVSAST